MTPSTSLIPLQGGNQEPRHYCSPPLGKGASLAEGLPRRVAAIHPRTHTGHCSPHAACLPFSRVTPLGIRPHNCPQGAVICPWVKWTGLDGVGMEWQGERNFAQSQGGKGRLPLTVMAHSSSLVGLDIAMTCSSWHWGLGSTPVPLCPDWH